MLFLLIYIILKYIINIYYSKIYICAYATHYFNKLYDFPDIK